MFCKRTNDFHYPEKSNSLVLMNNLSTVSFALLFFVWATIAGCASKENTQEEDPQQVRRDIPPTEVQVVEVVRKPFEYLINTSGRVRR